MAAFRLVEAFAVPLAVVTALFLTMAVQARARRLAPPDLRPGDAPLGFRVPARRRHDAAGDPARDLVYGPAYREAGDVLAILVWDLHCST